MHGRNSVLVWNRLLNIKRGCVVSAEGETWRNTGRKRHKDEPSAGVLVCSLWPPSWSSLTCWMQHEIQNELIAGEDLSIYSPAWREHSVVICRSNTDANFVRHVWASLDDSSCCFLSVCESSGADVSPKSTVHQVHQVHQICGANFRLTDGFHTKHHNKW